MNNSGQITDREQQILEWIRQNPMISQNDLAELAGISRSGIAAHILNLTKKGYLRGKGYIVAPQKYVTVIGGINMDIYGVSDNQFNTKTSNSGHINHMIGGLGRNISLNLRKLDVFNYFISVFGSDDEGERFKIDAADNDMDISYSKQIPDERTSSYIYLNDPSGERFVGLDDMKINDYITPAFLQDRIDVIRNSTGIVIDSNLPQKTIEWICDNFSVPIFAKAVSITKTVRLKNSLKNLETLVINGVEAPTLTEIVPVSKASAIKCADKLIKAGVKNVFLYVDNLGILYMNANEHIFYEQNYSKLANTNGDGAAATASLVLSYLKGETFIETAKAANVSVYVTAETNKAVNENMNIEYLEKRIKDYFK